MDLPETPVPCDLKTDAKPACVICWRNRQSLTAAPQPRRQTPGSRAARRIMMLRIIIALVLLLAGIVVGPMIAGHRGYVLIQTDNYNIETSVTGLAIISSSLWWCYSPLSGCRRLFLYRRAHPRVGLPAVTPSRPQADRTGATEAGGGRLSAAG